jgi:hypothetical protein
MCIHTDHKNVQITNSEACEERPNLQEDATAFQSSLSGTEGFWFATKARRKRQHVALEPIPMFEYGLP